MGVFAKKWHNKESKKLGRFTRNNAGKGGSQMDRCLVYAIVVVVGCAVCICIEHGKSILVMLGLQSDERDH